MRHAGPETLDSLEPLLESLRAFEALRERSRGTFYRGSAAFLHFHEDPTGVHADVKVGGEWERRRAQTARERAALVRRVEQVLSGG